MKWAIVVLMSLVAISLFSALVPMAKPEQDRKKMVRSLAFRVGFSILLFVMLWIFAAAGWIEPHGLSVPAQ